MVWRAATLIQARSLFFFLPETSSGTRLERNELMPELRILSLSFLLASSSVAQEIPYFDIKDIAANPTTFIGASVRTSGQLDEAYGPHLFRVEQVLGVVNAADTDILVMTEDSHQIKEGSTVEVQGEVYLLNAEEAKRIITSQLSSEALNALQGETEVIIATQLKETP